VKSPVYVHPASYDVANRICQILLTGNLALLRRLLAWQPPARPSTRGRVFDYEVGMDEYQDGCIAEDELELKQRHGRLDVNVAACAEGATPLTDAAGSIHV
jgi:hypothetical protein